MSHYGNPEMINVINNALTYSLYQHYPDNTIAINHVWQQSISTTAGEY